MTQPNSGPLTDREAALSTVGIESAAESIEASEQIAARMGNLYTPPEGMTFAQYRETIAFGASGDAPDAQDLSVAGVPVRRFTPATRDIVGNYVHLHGGGWCLGSHTGQDGRLQSLADATGLVVTSVGYRMAPEHPFPACLDDCVAVATAVSSEPGLHAIGGESAGAHLSVLTLITLRENGIGAFDAAVLTFGAYDLSAPRLDRPVSMLLPGWDRAARRDPAVSPLFADLTGLPPARFVIGTRDHLFDDNLMLHARWQRIAPAEIDVFAGAAHAFTTTPIAAADIARIREEDYLQRVFVTAP